MKQEIIIPKESVDLKDEAKVFAKSAALGTLESLKEPACTLVTKAITCVANKLSDWFDQKISA